MKACVWERFDARRAACVNKTTRVAITLDVWLPELAPSARLVSWALSGPFTSKRWANYERRYLSEMRKPPAQRLIALLAGLSTYTNFSIGCYCEDEPHCHRTLLRKLLIEHGATIAASGSEHNNRG